MEKSTITVDKKVFEDIMNLVNDMQLKLESLELMNDKEVVESHKKSKEQIKNREFADWDEL